MSETGADEGISKQIDIRAASTPAKDTGNSSVDLEHMAEGRRLVSAIRNILFGEGVRKAHYPGNNGRDGNLRFVTVDGRDKGVQIILSANEREQVPGDPIRPNFVEAIWLDENARQAGLVSFVDQKDGWSARANIMSDVPDDHIRVWNERGGMDYFPTGRSMTGDEVTKLAEQLESAKPISEMTEKAMKRLESEWQAQRLDAPAPQHSLPSAGDTKAIES